MSRRRHGEVLIDLDSDGEDDSERYAPSFPKWQKKFPFVLVSPFLAAILLRHRRCYSIWLRPDVRGLRGAGAAVGWLVGFRPIDCSVGLDAISSRLV